LEGELANRENKLERFVEEIEVVNFIGFDFVLYLREVKGPF
jgi:hypothetical protein